jgi:hypothetical protein
MISGHCSSTFKRISFVPFDAPCELPVSLARSSMSARRAVLLVACCATQRAVLHRSDSSRRTHIEQRNARDGLYNVK